MNKQVMPICPSCGNNRQVWKNQITGKLKCHRVQCEREEGSMRTDKSDLLKITESGDLI